MGLFTPAKEISLYEPKVEVKHGLKKIKISGVSRMADPGEFYTKFSDSLIEYFFEFKRTLFLEFNFENWFSPFPRDAGAFNFDLWISFLKVRN